MHFTTVLQLTVASISLPMHHNTSVICCQYQSTNTQQYFSYLLPVSVYRCTTIHQLSVASICLQMISTRILQYFVASVSLPNHHSTSFTCFLYQFTNAQHHSTSVTCCQCNSTNPPQQISYLLPVAVY